MENDAATFSARYVSRLNRMSTFRCAPAESIDCVADDVDGAARKREHRAEVSDLGERRVDRREAIREGAQILVHHLGHGGSLLRAGREFESAQGQGIRCTTVPAPSQ